MSESSRSKLIAQITAFIVVTAGVVGGGFWYIEHAEEQARLDAEQARRDAEPKRVTMGALYYVFAQTIEMAPLGLEGEGWDIDDSAPDVNYQLAWQGQTVFQSTEKTDTLIARWSGMQIGLEDAFALLKQGKADPGEIIDAALMRAKQGESFDLKVFDDDLTGDEDAGTLTIQWRDLAPGLNRLTGPVPGRGVLTVDLRVITDTGDLFKVIDALSGDAPAP